MSVFAVITGDIIRSSRMEQRRRDQLLQQLQLIFEDFAENGIEAQTEIFRGDSIQILLPQPQQALLTALLLRAGLRKMEHLDAEQTEYIDCRVSVGIGGLSYRNERLGMSDGEAFRLSGRGLDEMKKRQHLSIRTLWPEVNDEMEVACALSEAIISRWTHAQAAVIYAYLLSSKTQQQLAEEFGITQGAVSQRLSESGNMDAIKLFLQRFEKLVSSRL